MNNTKRLFALVVSVVMLMSMLSGFGFALDAEDAISSIDISGTGVGPAPSTDMEPLDVMADDVLIVDSTISVNDDVYSLVWNNEQIDDIPVTGKVFKSLYAVQYYAVDHNIVNPKVIIKKLDANTETVDITMALSLYTQAYNTMPFVAGENPLDPWQYNVSDDSFEDYDELTYELPKIVIGEKVTGTVGIYGFTLNGGIVNSDRKGSLDIELVNTVVDGNMSTVLALECEPNTVANNESLTVKNMYVRKTAENAKLFDGFIAANTIIDGMYIDGTSANLESMTEVNQAGLKSKMVIKNSYFYKADLPFAVGGDESVTMARSAVKTLSITSNIFNGLTSDSIYTVAFYPSRQTSLTFTKNYVAAEKGTAALFASSVGDEFNLTKLSVEVRDNILNGIANDFALSCDGKVLRDCKMDIADNFVTTEYSADLEGVEGTELNASEHGAFCKSYYSDYKMTNKCNGVVAIVSASATNGDVFVNSSTNTLYYIMNSGNATELSLTFGNDETTYKWFADSECTEEVSSEKIDTEITDNIYYIRSEFSNSEGSFYSEPYTVNIVLETPSIPYFSKAYTDPAGLLKGSAIFCDISCGWVSDGSLYIVEWQGEQYTFIKGVNLFENVETAVNFAKNNNMLNPQIVLLDMNGSHTYSSRWLPTYPGEYFTVNYATKPYIGQPGMEASEWKSNVGTEEGQYDVAKGITIGGTNISGNEVAGDYKLYGFTLTSSTLITDSRNSNRAGCINLHLENCYFDIPAWSWVLFSANDAAPTTANPTEDYLYIKNSYLDSHGTGYRLFSGWQASDITFDGVFFNVGSFSTARDYIKQNTSTASFRIINSHIKNYATYLENQSNNTDIVAGENKTFEFSNNIFNNARLHPEAAVVAYTKGWNNIIIKDNVIINETVEKFQMFKVLAQSTIANNPCKLEVTGNKGYNMLGTFDFGSRALTSDSIVENNYVTAQLYQGDKVTYAGIKLQACNGASPLSINGDYWLDSEMSLRPNVLMEDYDFKGVNVVTDKEAKTVKYVKLSANDIGVVEAQTRTGYEYTISLAHIIDNKYGNEMKLYDANDNKNKVNAYSPIVIKSETQLDTIQLKIDVSSPDGSAQPVTYFVTIAQEGPAVEGVVVGGMTAQFTDGKFVVELSGRGMNEEIEVTAKLEGTDVVITKDGNETTTVSTLNGTTDEYMITATYAGETVTVPLAVTRRGAEFDELDRVLSLTDAIDDSRWLAGFKGVFQNLRAKMSSIDRATAVQSEVDDYTARMEKLIEDAVTTDEFNATIKEAKKIKNKDEKYCTSTYQALQDVIDEAYNRVNTISDKESYDALIADIDAAVKGLKEHNFVTYVHDKDTENCVSNGSKTAKCSTPDCNATKTVAETENYKNDKHVFKNYVYNEDATHLADGTQTAMCENCKKVADTKTAANTKLVIINSATKFTDVKASDWYKQFIDYVSTYKFMNGTSDKTFAPTKTITRAEFVKLLANLSGVDTSNNSVSTKFTDVKTGEWYVGAVKWAADNGVVSGTSDTTFAPNAVITREQMCVMLVNYAKFAKITFKKTVDTTKFADDAKISDWAKDAVYACQSAGIVSGKGNGFDPNGTALRAEAAVIIKLFHENYLLA